MIHDWSRFDAGIFHDFHLAWIAEIRRVLNAGLLPPDYYALAEQIAGSIGPDVLTLQVPAEKLLRREDLPGAVAVADAPPKVRHIMRSDNEEYALKQSTLVIRHRSNHRIIALVEIVSPDKKSSRHALRAFVDKATSALSWSIHLLIVDLHPPGPRDPHGLHAVIWEELTAEAFVPPADKPLTAAAYAARPAVTAYVEPLAVGDPLPEMPLFLDPEQYINVPLAATYQAAYEGVPRFYRDILER